MTEIKTSNVLLDEFLSLKRIPQKEDFLPILELPRQELIADLEKVLNAIIANVTKDNQEEIYQKEQEIMALSCVFLLTELKSMESTPLYFRLFSMDNNFLDYYFSGHVYETLWLTLFEIGDTDAIFDFLKNTDVTSIGAGIAMDSLTQIALHFPDLNEKIKKGFIDLYTYLHENNKNFRIETDDTNLLFIRTLDFTEFYHTLKIFYDSDRIGVNEDIRVPFDMIIDDLVEFQEYFEDEEGLKEILSLEEKYNNPATEEMLRTLEESFDRLIHAVSGFENNTNKFHKSPNHKMLYSDYTPYVKATPTVGRNEPCPCGSGKKYKKCCEK